MPRKTSISREQFNGLYGKLKQDGLSDVAIAKELAVSPMTVLRWKKDLPLVELSDAQPPGPVRPAPAAPTERVSDRDLQRRIVELQEENELLKRILSNHLIDAVLSEERLKRKP